MLAIRAGGKCNLELVEKNSETSVVHCGSNVAILGNGFQGSVSSEGQRPRFRAGFKGEERRLQAKPVRDSRSCQKADDERSKSRTRLAAAACRSHAPRLRFHSGDGVGHNAARRSHKLVFRAVRLWPSPRASAPACAGPLADLGRHRVAVTTNSPQGKDSRHITMISATSMLPVTSATAIDFMQLLEDG